MENDKNNTKQSIAFEHNANLATLGLKQNEDHECERGNPLNTLPSLRVLTQIIYFCEALAFLFGITAVIGICVNYLKRDAVKGTIYESHFIWQIRTFWVSLGADIIGWITTIFLFGFLIIAAVIIWNIYRVVKGYLLLLDNKPIPDPYALP